MKVDLYTKLVLTVIAACLVALVLGASSNPAADVVKVKIVGIERRADMPMTLPWDAVHVKVEP